MIRAMFGILAALQLAVAQVPQPIPDVYPPTQPTAEPDGAVTSEKFHVVSGDGGDHAIVSVANQNGVFDFGSGSWSVACRFKSTETGQYKAVIGSTVGVAAWTNIGWRLYTHAGKIALSIADGTDVAGTSGTFIGTSTVCDGIWHDLVWVVDHGAAQVARLIVDGVQESTIDITDIGDVTTARSVALLAFVGDDALYWNHAAEVFDLRVWTTTAITEA